MAGYSYSQQRSIANNVGAVLEACRIIIDFYTHWAFVPTFLNVNDYVSQKTAPFLFLQ